MGLLSKKTSPFELKTKLSIYSANLLSMAQSMTDVIEMQQDLKDVVEIGNDLGKYQKQLGINTVQLESAITNIRIREGQCCYQHHDLGYGCGYEWWPGTD